MNMKSKVNKKMILKATFETIFVVAILTYLLITEPMLFAFAAVMYVIYSFLTSKRIK